MSLIPGHYSPEQLLLSIILLYFTIINLLIKVTVFNSIKCFRRVKQTCKYEQ